MVETWAYRLGARVAGTGLVFFARLVTAPRAIWAGVAPVRRQRIYFANHTSNGDFVLLWSVLPRELRQETRPVAAADYWLKSPLRRFVGRDVFRAVLIERRPEAREDDPLRQIGEALESGASLILFPEGRRNETDAELLPLKAGLFNLATRYPDVELVPVWIANLNRVMPRGEIVPIPLLCTVTFGAPLERIAEESKDGFGDRAAAALLALKAEGA